MFSQATVQSTDRRKAGDWCIPKKMLHDFVNGQTGD